MVANTVNKIEIGTLMGGESHRDVALIVPTKQTASEFGVMLGAVCFLLSSATLSCVCFYL